jgi:hypothetical protein
VSTGAEVVLAGPQALTMRKIESASASFMARMSLTVHLHVAGPNRRAAHKTHEEAGLLRAELRVWPCSDRDRSRVYRSVPVAAEEVRGPDG